MSYIFKKKIKRSKKAQLLDVITIMIIVTVVAMALMTSKYVLNQFYSALDDSGASSSPINTSRDGIEAGYAVFDFAFLFLIIGMTISLIITSFMIPSHPVFMVINLLGIFFLVLMGMVMSNVYSEFVAGADTAPIFGTVADDYPVINFLVNYIGYIGALIVTISTIVMYARGQS